MTADYADFTAPQAHADRISNTGVPLLHRAKELLVDRNHSIAAGATVQLVNTAYTQPSYEIQFTPDIAAAATIPFALVRLGWISSVSGLVIARDVFFIPVGQTGSGIMTIQGRGPAKGDTATLQVKNLDPAQALNITSVLIQSSRVFERDVWGLDPDDTTASVPGFTKPDRPDDFACLGKLSNATIPASSTSTFLFGMWDGLVGMTAFMNTGAASSLTVQVRPQPDSQYGAQPVSFAPAAGTLSGQFAGARAPLRVDLINSSAGALGVTFALWAIR